MNNFFRPSVSHWSRPLRASKLRQLSLVASANTNGVAFCNPDGTITWANEAFSELTGYAPAEVIGKTPLELCKGPLSDRDVLREMVDDFGQGRNFSLEVIHYRKDGSWFWGRASGQSILDPKGRVLQYFAVVEDISERKRTEEALIEARRFAEDSSRSKEVFLANMSHEIRTPLNAILGLSHQLQKTGLDEQQRTYVDTVNAAAENLLVIINDILDISKIEAGKLNLERIGFRLDDVLMKVRRVMQLKAEEKGLELSCSIAEDAQGVRIGDPLRLSQVLLNLVSNAIKFTQKGGVRMECSAPGSVVSIRVSDTGIGMSEEFLANLFQKFLQEDKTVARKFGGTGLGMSICKQLAELMGGSIRVESQKGVGTDVWLSIPFETGTEKDIPVREELSVNAGLLKGKRVLLVEDNELNRFVAVTNLRHWGTLVEAAINGQEAVDKLRQHRFDLVLMDVQMPVMDGLEATRILRSELGLTTPVVALTASAIKGELDPCLEAGMNDYLTKPFREEELVRILVKWLS